MDRYTQLLSECAIGNKESFAQLYQLASPKLNGIALRMLGKKELADEVLQDAFVKIWHNASSFRPDLSSAMTWMTTITRNRALDSLRQNQRNMEIFDDNVEDFDADNYPSLSIDDNVNESLIAKGLKKCLDLLKKQHRDCVEMAYIYGFSYKELAEKMDSPQGSVKVWAKRGLEKLKKCLVR